MTISTHKRTFYNSVMEQRFEWSEFWQMAKQIAGVYEILYECATREFLEKGYSDASLREIAKAADTSTGSIYTRFKDKAGLFCAIVEPAVTGFKERFLDAQDSFLCFGK